MALNHRGCDRSILNLHSSWSRLFFKDYTYLLLAPGQKKGAALGYAQDGQGRGGREGTRRWPGAGGRRWQGPLMTPWTPHVSRALGLHPRASASTSTSCTKNAQAAPLLAAGGNEGLWAGGSMPPAKGRLWVYNDEMVLRRTPHAVYDTLYHLVWSPKYRRDVLQGEVQQRVQALFADIAEQYDITIEEMEVSPDHIHLFCSFPPRYSIAQVVTRFKSLSARAIFREFPRIKRRLWGGELWEDGYFARTVGDKVTAEVIRRYIQHHRLEKIGDAQLSLFE